MIVKLLGYMPDADQTIIGVLTNCSGVVPSLKGFKGAPTPSSTPLSSVGATVQGAAVLYKPDLTTRFFVGTPTKIYEGGASTWADVSRSAVYTTAATGRWRFAQTGTTSLAANGTDTMQASTGSAFSCISGGPQAAIVETVGNFVFALNINGTANKIQWAAQNGYTDWTPSVNTQAGQTTLTSTPGPILAGRRFGTNLVVYKRSSMYLGTYTGAPTIWQFDQIPGNAGALSQEVVVNIGTPDNPKHIFMGEDNFYLFDGSKPVPLGDNRLSQTVFGSLQTSRYYACQALHDPKNFLVYFYYPVSDSVFPDHCVVYNYRTNQWGVDDRQIQAAVNYVAAGTTYNGVGGLYSTYGALPSLTYDSAFIASSSAVPAIFNMSNEVKTLTGVAAATSFTTGDLGDDVKLSTVERVRPRWLTAPDSATLTPYYRMEAGGDLSADTAVALMDGKFDYMREARWHRHRYDMVGNWEAGALSLEFIGDSLE